MITKVTIEPASFQPVTISHTFNTAKELYAYAILCNTTIINDALEFQGGSRIDTSEMIKYTTHEGPIRVIEFLRGRLS